MNFRSLTWPQVVLLLGGFACVIAAYKLVGPEAASIVSLALHLAAASSAPKDPPAPPAVQTDALAPPARDAKGPPATPFAGALLFAGV